MFDEVFGILEGHTETFHDGVRDAFAESITNDVLEPIRRQIGLLCTFNEESQRHAFNVEQILDAARLIIPLEGQQQ